MFITEPLVRVPRCIIGRIASSRHPSLEKFIESVPQESLYDFNFVRGDRNKLRPIVADVPDIGIMLLWVIRGKSFLLLFRWIGVLI